MTANKRTVTLTLRAVNKNAVHKNYAVWEFYSNGEVKQVTKNYAHSTSAFAALGRLTQKETSALTK